MEQLYNQEHGSPGSPTAPQLAAAPGMRRSGYLGGFSSRINQRIEHAPCSSNGSIARLADVAGLFGETGENENIREISGRGLFAVEQVDLGLYSYRPARFPSCPCIRDLAPRPGSSHRYPPAIFRNVFSPEPSRARTGAPSCRG